MNFCPNCGSELKGDPVYCSNCGKRLHGDKSVLAHDQREIAKIQIEYKEAKRGEKEAESAAAGIPKYSALYCLFFFWPHRNDWSIYTGRNMLSCRCPFPYESKEA